MFVGMLLERERERHIYSERDNEGERERGVENERYSLDSNRD